jgi:hypothetical protein
VWGWAVPRCGSAPSRRAALVGACAVLVHTRASPNQRPNAHAETDERTTGRAQKATSARLRARPTNDDSEAATRRVSRQLERSHARDSLSPKRGVSGGELGHRGQSTKDKREPSQPVLPMGQAHRCQAPRAAQDQDRLLRRDQRSLRAVCWHAAPLHVSGPRPGR